MLHWPVAPKPILKRLSEVLLMKNSMGSRFDLFAEWVVAVGHLLEPGNDGLANPKYPATPLFPPM
jgi:hypothetical protein